MRNLKKLASLLLALVMVLSLTVTASAYTIELSGAPDKVTEGHTYNVYQIFTGDLAFADTDERTLSNIKYGANYHPDVVEAGESKTVNPGDPVPSSELNITDARAFAEDLMENNKITGDAFFVLNKENNWSSEGKKEIPAGYYLIVDNGTPAEGDSYSAYIVEVVEDVSIAPKSSTITSDKKIKTDDHEDDNGTDDSVTTDGKNNNGAIGSQVDFELTVDVPANADKYTYYYCVLNDTLSEGLTFDASSVKVYVDGTLVTKDTDYKLYTATEMNTDTYDHDNNPTTPNIHYTFQIAMMNAKALADKVITVTYSATVNENAKIGIEGNPNEFDVTYSNNPNYDYNDGNGNGKPDDQQNIPTGTTPEKETITYVTGIKLMKTDGSKALTGAEFELTGTTIKTILISGKEFVLAGEGETATHYLLKDGTYTTEAPRTKDVFVVKTGDRDSGYVYDATVEGDYRTATDDELKGTVPLYTKLFANINLYQTGNLEYILKDATEKVEIKENVTAKAFVDANGFLVFEGLGEGVFKIEEITTPAGYNTIAPIDLEIKWIAPTEEGSTECKWEAKANGSAVTFNEETGVFELTVVNQAGSQLPETGGMGTTLFYIAGGILVLAAVVLLVTKKRMQNAE